MWLSEIGMTLDEKHRMLELPMSLQSVQQAALGYKACGECATSQRRVKRPVCEHDSL